MPALLVLFIVFIVLGFIVFIQLFYAFKEKFKDTQRIRVLGLLTIVLALTFFKPNGLINFDELEGKDILIAQREGAANCMTTFRLKEGNKFTERRVCFGLINIKGNFKLKDDTIFFENVKLGRHLDEYYEFAVIKKSPFSWNKGGFDLYRYKNHNDTVGHFLTVTKNEMK
jgi:hypothetical protein